MNTACTNDSNDSSKRDAALLHFYALERRACGDADVAFERMQEFAARFDALQAARAS
jgi:hypothetical protein